MANSAVPSTGKTSSGSPSSALASLQSELQAAATPVRQATVSLGQDHRGSGVVVSDGVVLTNAHVLRSRTIQVRFADGRIAQAEVSGVDADGDLAALKVDTTGVAPLKWAEAAGGPGSLVLAGHGNGTVALGMIGSTGRSFRGPRGRTVSDTVEHSARLGRGASGGPLVDIDGRLIGINTARSDAGYRAVAASPELAARIAKLVDGNDVTRPTLGIAIVPGDAAKRVRSAAGLPERDGVLIQAVADDGPAAKAGLAQGDLLVTAGGTPISSVDDLHRALDAATGESLELGVVRGADERTVTVSW
jgi:S1-C subfamily serine protease